MTDVAARRQVEPLELPRRMAPSDALFWYAETALPVFRPIIGGLYVLDRPPDADRLHASVEAALALVPRLAQRVVEAPLHLSLPEWQEDPHLDLAYHLRHLSLPAPGGQRELLDLTAQLLATPLDRERPLWESYRIDGLAGGRSAYFFKMHHSVVDGVGSLAILRALTQAERDDAVLAVACKRTRRRAARPEALGRWAGLALGTAQETVRLAGRAAGAGLHVATHPTEAWDELGRTLRGLRGVVDDLRKPTIHDPLATSSSGLSRRLDVIQLPLERLRKIKAPLGVTLNDVVLAALAGTLGAYHRERRVRVTELNCLVPMNLRARDERDVLGNRVGMCNVVLPLAERSVQRRLARIVEQTTVAKRDKRGAAYPFLLQSLTLIPGEVFRFLARHSLGRVNVACTNIPGVPTCRYMSGAEIEAIYPFASVVEGTPLVMALLSYAGRMDIGIDTDPEAIPDPHRISELFEDSLAELEALSSRAAGRGTRAEAGS